LAVDGDGVLSKNELARAGVQLNVLNSLDDNQDGLICRTEFAQGIQLLNIDANNADADVNLDRSVSKKEKENHNNNISENNKKKKVVDNNNMNKNDNNNDNTDSSAVDEIVDKFEEQIGALEPLERQELRLGGFEPYILVSVLTAQSSFEEISNTNVNSWTHILHPTSIVDVLSSDLLNAGILLSAGLSTIAGIYATVVFSLTILYGKTALGMDRDEDYYSFMDGTGLQRFRAFQAFTYGLFFFLISVCTELCLKSPTELRIPSVILAIVALYYGKQEYDIIMAAASPMFVPKVSSSPPPPLPIPPSLPLKEDKDEEKEVVEEEIDVDVDLDVVVVEVESTNKGIYIAPPTTITTTTHSISSNDKSD